MLRGGEQTLLLMTGSAVTEKGLALAAQIAGKTGCKVMGPLASPRMARGRGRFSIDRVPYVIEQALAALKDFRHIVLVEANDPVAFFAYPNKPSLLKPEGCEVHRMTASGENSVAALEALASARRRQAGGCEAAGHGRTRQADGCLEPCVDRAGDRRWRFRKTPSSSTNPSPPGVDSFR